MSIDHEERISQFARSSVQAVVDEEVMARALSIDANELGSSLSRISAQAGVSSEMLARTISQIAPLFHPIPDADAELSNHTPVPEEDLIYTAPRYVTPAAVPMDSWETGANSIHRFVAEWVQVLRIGRLRPDASSTEHRFRFRLCNMAGEIQHHIYTWDEVRQLDHVTVWSQGLKWIPRYYMPANLFGPVFSFDLPPERETPSSPSADPSHTRRLVVIQSESDTRV